MFYLTIILLLDIYFLTFTSIIHNGTMNISTQK